MILRAIIAIGLTICVLSGCSGKGAAHDDPPPAGTPKRGIPKFIREKNGKV